VSRPRVLVTEVLGDAALELLAAGGVEVEAYDLLPAADFLPRLAAADAVIVRSAHRVEARHLEAAPRLRVVARAGTGVDNIDVEAATARGVLVLNTSGANAQAAAEHTWGLLLALVRHIRLADRHVRAGGWDRAAFYGEELAGKTLGVVGIGRVGGRVARFGRAFGMRVLAYDPFVPAETVAERGAEKVERLADLLPRADVLTLHTPKTGPRLGYPELARLPRGAYVLNVARGGLLDEAALLRLLEEGHLAGVALDVFAEEPPGDHPLLERDDVLVTCHLGGSTTQAQHQIGVRIARAVLAALRGELPDEAVNVPYPDGDGDRVVAAGDTLGRLAAALGGGRDMAVAGGEGTLAAELLGRAFLAGYLAVAGDDSVNVVNSLLRAEAHGLRLRLQSTVGETPEPEVFTAALGSEVITLAATAGGLRLRAFAGATFDLLLGEHLLWTRHRDVPGIVGRVGTALENGGINIGTLALSRRAPGGEAVMVLTVDQVPGEELVRRLTRLPDVLDAGHVHLPLAAPRTAVAHAR
jgi:D-3-phosphoglycerate dehydrogenase